MSTNIPVITGRNPTSFRWAPTASRAAMGRMPTSKAGQTNNRPWRERVRSAQVAAITPMTDAVAAIRCARRQDDGMTLLEALIVVALVAMIAGLSFPSVTSGLDTLRLRSASDSIVSFLNVALDHADRRQQAVEVVISPRENLLLSRTADLGFSRRLAMPAQIHIVRESDEPRRRLAS